MKKIIKKKFERNSKSDKPKEMFNFKLIIILIVLLYSSLINAQTSKTIIYIDPTNTGVQKGTTESPLSKFPALKSNTIYLVKGGTTMTLTGGITVNVDNITISTYGTGNATIKGNFDGKMMYLTGKNNRVENLNFIQSARTVQGVFGLRTNGGRCWINNVHTTGGYKGIGAGSYGVAGGKAYITNCSANTTVSDNFYINDLDSAVVKNCRGWNVALGWPGDTGGDCIQFDHVSNIIVDNCNFDHTNDGKFCLIALFVSTIKLTNTVMLSKNNSACIYTGGDAAKWDIENCYFYGGRYGIQNNAALLIKNCVFKDQQETAIFEGADKWIYNCTFANIASIGIRNWAGRIKELKNCIFYGVQNPIAGLHDTVTYNCRFNSGALPKDSKYTITVDPKFVNYSQNDLRLSSNSPCINAGTNNVPAKFDINHTKRPQGTKIDIGAFEYIENVIITTPPKIFNVTGGGTGCAGSGIQVGLNGSEKGISYQLYCGNTSVGNAAPGTGNAISFGNQINPGVYKVVATDPATKASRDMSGTANVTINPAPKLFDITGGGTITSANTGLTIGLSGSESGVNYQLYLATSMVGQAIEGTGSILSFGKQTVAGTYKVVAKKMATSCTGTMTGSATITVNILPQNNFTLSDPVICNGDKATIDQNGSETGVNYQLRNALTQANIGTAIPGTGSAIQFTVNPTNTTEYQVLAQNTVTASSIVLNDRAKVTVNGVPAKPQTPKGNTFISIPSYNQYNYTIDTVSNATTYTWSLNPTNSGNITGNGTNASVTWNGNYPGTASVIVVASNACGSSSSSQPLVVTLKKGTTGVPTVINGTWNLNDIFNKYPDAEITLFDIHGRFINRFNRNKKEEWAPLSNKIGKGVFLYVIDLKNGKDPIKGKLIIQN